MQRFELSQLRVLLLLAILLALPACSTYKRQGTTVIGNRPGVFIVDADDPRLRGDIVEESSVEITLDASTLRPKPMPSTPTDEKGRFVVDVDEPGAGVLEYTAGILARAPKFQHVYQEVKLPAASKRVLIVMKPGRDTYQPKEDLLKEAETFKRQFQ